MTTYRPRIQWYVAVALGASGLLMPGCCSIWPCDGDCADYQVDVRISTQDYLVADGMGQDTSDLAPILHVEITPPDSEYSSAECPLTYAEGEGFTLGSTMELTGAGPDAQEDVEVEEFVLSFDLLWQSDGGGGDEFATIKQGGGEPQVDLWNGWTLDLAWFGPYSGCK